MTGYGALQGLEGMAYGGPVVCSAGPLHAGAQELHGLVGDDGDEEVAVGAALLVVEDGAQAELGLERAEHGLDVGEGDVGLPQGLGIEVEDVGTQAVDPRVAHHGSLGRFQGPGDGDGLPARVIGGDGDLVVPGDTAVGLLETPDAALDMIESLAGAGSGKTFVEISQTLLEASLEALQDAPFLGLPGRGMAAQENLPAGRTVPFLATDLFRVDVHRLPGRGDHPRRFSGGVEDPGAVAGDHEIAVSVTAQPGEIGLRGNAAVHDDHASLGRSQGRQHRAQCMSLGDVAGKDARTAHKARSGENQTQGQQGRVRAPLLRVTPPGLGLS